VQRGVESEGAEEKATSAPLDELPRFLPRQQRCLSSAGHLGTATGTLRIILPPHVSAPPFSMLPGSHQVRWHSSLPHVLRPLRAQNSLELRSSTSDTVTGDDPLPREYIPTGRSTRETLQGWIYELVLPCDSAASDGSWGQEGNTYDDRCITRRYSRRQVKIRRTS
jgi:hypothetical protein